MLSEAVWPSEKTTSCSKVSDTRMAITTDGQHEHATTFFNDFYASARKIPLGRGGKAEECAGAFVYLLSNLSSYVTGQVIIVDGGLTATY